MPSLGPARLDCPILPYAWGSRTVLAEMTGRPSPTPEPEAELWMGAHPRAPATVELPGGRRPLSDLVAAAPRLVLGDAVAASHAGRLPFLLKVLAIDQPLSIQAHPDAEQARAGFAAEEAAGVPRDAPHRTYRDPHPKPELIYALTPFEALCGFRPVDEAAAALHPVLPGLAERLRAEGPLAALAALLQLPGGRVRQAIDGLAAGDGEAATLVRRLAAVFPGDAGVLGALLLRRIHLEPGEALFLRPRHLHAYLGGVGVEIMASSDNVLRGGLTVKHVDVPGLLEVVHGEPGGSFRVQRRVVDEVERAYDTPTPAFALSVLELGPATSPSCRRRTERGAEILFCAAGAVEIRAEAGAIGVEAGGAVLVPACCPTYRISGEGRVFRATAGGSGSSSA